MDQQQQFEAKVARALVDLEQRLIVARRREQRAMGIFVLALTVTVAGWTPLLGQAPKTMEDRVSDLEKRTGGVQIEDGTTRLTAPLEIYDAQGRLVAALSAADGEGLFSVGGKDRGYVGLGTSSNGAGFIKVLGANRKVSVAIGPQHGQEGRGVFVMDGAGRSVEAALTIGANNQPRLGIGDSDAGGVNATVSDNGNGVLSVRHADGNLGVVAGATAAVRMGVYALGEGGSGGVNIYADKLGGNVRVVTPQGIPVGGLFSEEEGGGLVLTGPAGGDSVVDLGVRDSGGSVRVFSVGGSTTRAAIEANSNTGGVTAYASDGKPAATMTSRPGGSGYFQLLLNGIGMVEAGANTDGVGEVRAGPSSQKVVGVLAVPYRLVGRK